MMKQSFFLLTLLFTLITLGCQNAAQEQPLLVREVWGRVSPMSAENGAFYMQIENNSDKEEALLSATSSACGTTELHEVIMADDVMQMRPVTGGKILIPIGQTVELKPGGLHVMCLQKKGEFVEGTEIELSLNFANAGTVLVSAEIRNP